MQPALRKVTAARPGVTHQCALANNASIADSGRKPKTHESSISSVTFTRAPRPACEEGMCDSALTVAALQVICGTMVELS